MAPKSKKAAAKAQAAPKAEEPKVEEAKVEEPKVEEVKVEEAVAPKAEGKKKAAAPKAKAEAKAEPKAEPKAAPKAKAEPNAEPKAKAEPPKVSDVARENVEKFLTGGIETMKSNATKEKLADKSAGRPGGTLIDLQQKLWDDMGVDRNKGRQAVDEIEKRFEDHEDLVKARDLFIRTAQLTYLQSLEDRKPEELETKQELTRESVLEFCDACCAKSDLKETKDAMGAMLKEGEMPDQVILDIQMDMFETLGYEREHGKDSLEKLETLYPKDQELMRSTGIWQNKGQTTCLIVLDKHMLEGGELPDNPQKEALELQVLQHRAKEQLSQMTPQERGDLFEKLRKKVQIFRSIPPEARQKHMQKQTLEDRLELIKGDVLFATVSEQQQQQRQRQEQQKQHQAFMKRQVELKDAEQAKEAAFEERKAKAHARASKKKHAC